MQQNARRVAALMATVVVFIFISKAIVLAQVKPINWSAFKKPNPTDSLSLLERDILLNANKYALTTWYNDAKKFGAQTTHYLDLGGTQEHFVRPVASEAMALAVALKTGVYNDKVTSISQARATQTALKLVSSIAYHHKVNQANGWGEAWQSALWTAFAGTAGWLLWDELPATDKANVQRMVEFEANRLNNYQIPYLRDKAGELTGSKDDSKSEENSWNAMIFHVALAMMPGHPNKKLWMAKNIELLLSASARPQDVNSAEMYNGKRLKDILNGSNFNSDGTVTNHARIHPDYMACTCQTFYNALMFGLAQLPAPKAALFNTDVIYQTMVDFKFSSPPYLQPGGSIYRANFPEVYYPATNDWGRGRKMHFALMDCQMSAFKMDTKASKPGAFWEAIHARAVLKLQQRNADGHCYQAENEDTYKGREEWVAVHAAQAYLTKWLQAQGKLKITNKAY